MSKAISADGFDYRIDYLGLHRELIPQIVQLWSRNWIDYPVEKILENTNGRLGVGFPPFLLVTYQGSELLGTVGLLPDILGSGSEPDAWIGGLLVNPEFRNRGIARELLDEVNRLAAELGYSETRLYTEFAGDFYRHLGWTYRG